MGPVQLARQVLRARLLFPSVTVLMKAGMMMDELGLPQYGGLGAGVKYGYRGKGHLVPCGNGPDQSRHDDE